MQWLEHEAAFASLGSRLSVGDIVGARVVFYQGKKCIVRLSAGVLAWLEYKFAPSPNGKQEWIDSSETIGLLDVLVQSIDPHTKRIVVSAHKFGTDDRFNLFNSGYRGFIERTAVPKLRLPWQK